jgi:hypothetical protein
MLRYGRAWAQALDTGRRLVADFGAARVVAVGALVEPHRFGPQSEIELVVWGLRADVLPAAAAPGRHGPVPAAIHDGDRLTAAQARRVRAEGVEIARRAEP